MNPVSFLPQSPLARIIIGFTAAFVSTLTFHEIGYVLGNLMGLGKFNVLAMDPVGPFQVPRLINLSFWGGLWGILYVFIVKRFPTSIHPFIAGFLFAVLVPTLFSWTVLATARGVPVMLGFDVMRLIGVTFINGLWGVGLPILTVLFSRLLMKKA